MERNPQDEQRQRLALSWMEIKREGMRRVVREGARGAEDTQDTL